MSLLAAAQNTVALFIGLELLSIPLYVLCATEMRREHSLESGLKYLIIGSVGSATLLYGLALIYGATGATDFGAIASALSSGGLATDLLPLTGIALCVAGLCFKASVAPFHQWTPDVYEGAPTPVTAFMAVATKVAAFGVFLRFFDVALIDAQGELGSGAGGARDDHDHRRQRRRARAVLAEADARLLVGRAGRLHARGRRRRDAARRAGDGLLPGGVPVHEHGRVRGDRRARARNRARRLDRRGRAGSGASARWLAWPMTLVDARPRRDPGDGGVHRQVLPDRRGRLRRLHVAGRRDRDRLDDLARLLPAGGRGDVDARGAGRQRRGAARRHSRRRRLGGALPALAGGSPELDELRRPAPTRSPSRRSLFVAILAGAATLFFGIVPQPLFDLVHRAGSALGLF